MPGWRSGWLAVVAQERQQRPLCPWGSRRSARSSYDTSGWNARKAYHVQLGPGELVKVDEERAAAPVRDRSGRVVGSEPMEIAQPPWRHRLWSIRDNQIGFYLTHLESSRERRRRLSRSLTEPELRRGPR